MKKNSPIFIVCLLLTLFYFCSCDNKLNDRQIIEEIRNSPRDPRLIGKWKKLDVNLQKVRIGVHYQSDGVLERGFPMYEKNNEIAYYRSDHQIAYFHTINDSVIVTFLIRHDFEDTSYFISENYKMIHEDTIHFYNSDYQSIGIRDNDIDITVK